MEVQDACVGSVRDSKEDSKHPRHIRRPCLTQLVARQGGQRMQE